MKKELCESRLKKFCKRFGIISGQANAGKYFAELNSRHYTAESLNGLHKAVFGYK